MMRWVRKIALITLSYQCTVSVQLIPKSDDIWGNIFAHLVSIGTLAPCPYQMASPVLCLSGQVAKVP